MYKAIAKQIIELIESPRTAWEQIESENKSVGSIQKEFFYPLLALVVVATIAGALINAQSFALDQTLKDVVIVFTASFIGYFAAIFFLNEIIGTRLFQLEKQYASCVRIIAYSSSIMFCVNIITALFPDLFILYIANFYSAYIIWESSGIVLKGLKENQKGIFTTLCFILLYGSPYLIETLMHFLMR